MLRILVFLGVGNAVWVFAGRMLLCVRRQRRTATFMRETGTSRISAVPAGDTTRITLLAHGGRV